MYLPTYIYSKKVSVVPVAAIEMQGTEKKMPISCARKRVCVHVCVCVCVCVCLCGVCTQSWSTRQSLALLVHKLVNWRASGVLAT